MKWFFILGRNPELSRAEVLSYLEARGRTHKEVLFEENYLVIETNEGERIDIQEFGGVMKLGMIGFEGGLKEFEDFIDKNELIPSDKFSYGVYGNCDVEILKEKFKSEKKRAMLRHGRKQLMFQGGEKVENPNAEFSLFFHEVSGNIFFGNVSQEYDYSSVKKRDMSKPFRRESLAISPRLSKILINLSGAKRGSLMLDPFCGIGSILMEALVKSVNVHGIDKDRDAIRDCRQNIEWLSKEFGFEAKYTVENKDSRKVDDLQFEAIATETPLGKLMKKKPRDNEAEQVITNFEAFIIPILRRLKISKKKTARIAITFPVIRNFRVDSRKISEKCGLKIVVGPITESRSDQFIGRDVIVFV